MCDSGKVTEPLRVKCVRTDQIQTLMEAGRTGDPETQWQCARQASVSLGGCALLWDGGHSTGSCVLSR